MVERATALFFLFSKLFIPQWYPGIRSCTIIRLCSSLNGNEIANKMPSTIKEMDINTRTMKVNKVHIIQCNDCVSIKGGCLFINYSFFYSFPDSESNNYLSSLKNISNEWINLLLMLILSKSMTIVIEK